MKKFLLPVLVAAVSPLMANAQAENPALTFINNTSNTTTTEDRLDVPASVIDVTTQSQLSVQSITIGCWTRMTNRASEGNVIFVYGGLNHNNGNGLIVLKTKSSGEIVLGGFGIRERLGFGADQATGVTLPLNEWHYLAVAIDFENYEVRLCLDNAIAKTLTFDSSKEFGSFDDSPFGFGFGQLCYNGAIDDIHIVKRAITDSDLKNLYEDKANNVSDLKAWYTLDEVRQGSSGHFANMMAPTDNTQDAIYYRVTGQAPGWAGGIIDNTRTESTPNMSTIDATTERKKSGSAAIDDIVVDGEDGPAEYFNLQGVKVSADNLVPGIYILRQGSKTSKVLIRN